MVHQQPVKCLGQVGRAVSSGQRWVLSLQEGRLVLHLVIDVLLIHDVLLRAIHYTDDAQLDGNDPTAQDIDGISTSVHEIQLGDHCQGAPAIGIHVLGQLKRLTSGHVRIGGRHSQNDRVGVLNILENQVFDLGLDILRLIAHRHLGDAGQIHQRQVDHVCGEYLQVNRLRTDALVGAGGTFRFVLDLVADLIEVRETLLGVEEAAPLLSIGGACKEYDLANDICIPIRG